MKKSISIVAILGLSACMGSGGGGVTVGGSGEPDPAVTSDITTLMQGARSNSIDPIFYDSAVGRVAQDHAEDMVARNYIKIADEGTSCEGGIRECDMGDDLNDLGLNWNEIVQMVAEGEKTVPVVFAEFRNRDLSDDPVNFDSDGNRIPGDLGQKLNDALMFDENYEFFGLGKAGSGADTKWAFIFVDPNDTWTDRLP